MSTDWVDLRQIRYFIAAAETENFRRAAAMVHVAQPALSRQIREMEAALGVRLFERRKKRVFLTEVGRFYLEKAKDLTARAAAFQGLAQRLQQGASGSIKLGLQEVATRHRLVLDIVRSFRRLPHVDLQISSATSPAQIDALLSGKLDAGFLYDVPCDTTDLDRLDISIDGFGLALPEDHPLLDRDTIRMEDLRSVPQIVLAEDVSPLLYRRIIGAFHTAGYDPVIFEHARSEHDLFCLVSSGCGVALMTTPYIQRIGIVYRDVEGLHIPRILSMAWHAHNEQPLLRKLRDLVTDRKAEAREICGRDDC